jgi:uncharacterized delta-60 repeat protein
MTMTRTYWAAAAAGLATLTLSVGVALGAPADVDGGFGSEGRTMIDGGGNDDVRALAVQPDGKIVVVGSTSIKGGDALVLRLNRDGSPDRGFDGDGVVTIDRGANEDANAVAIQPDGKIVVAGHTSSGLNGVVYRLNANGSPDLAFGDQGAAVLDSAGDERINAVALQPDGRIVAAGFTSVNKDMAIYRLTETGAPDKSFDMDGARGVDGGGTEAAYGVAIQPDGKVVAAGYSSVNNDGDPLVARLTSTGQPDTDFGNAGKTRITGTDDYAEAMALQPDGKIVLAGHTQNGQTNYDATVYRLRPSGAPDNAFNEDGRIRLEVGDYEEAKALAVQPDGKIVVSGETSVGDDGVVWRVTESGARDNTFGADGQLLLGGGGLESAVALALQADGKIVLAGTRDAVNDDALVYRLLGDSAPAQGPSGGPQGPGGPAPEVTVCAGRRATIVGTAGRDRIRGTRRRDVIATLGGSDVIRGLGGDDLVCAGSGNDLVLGGAGTDTLRGQAGRDRLLGGSGRDRLIGGPGRDRLVGGPGRDDETRR